MFSSWRKEFECEKLKEVPVVEFVEFVCFFCFIFILPDCYCSSVCLSFYFIVCIYVTERRTQWKLKWFPCFTLKTYKFYTPSIVEGWVSQTASQLLRVMLSYSILSAFCEADSHSYILFISNSFCLYPVFFNHPSFFHPSICHLFIYYFLLFVLLWILFY